MRQGVVVVVLSRKSICACRAADSAKAGNL